MINRYETKIKLGFAPTRRNVFSREDSQKYKALTQEKIKSLPYIEIIDLDWLNDEGMLFNSEDVPKIVKKFSNENVDAIFSPHCNFGTEDAVVKLGQAMNKPYLLWGPRDEMPLPNGQRLRDSMCGLFATSKAFQRMGVPFTYIMNCRIEDNVFASALEVFARSSAIVKKAKNLRIGQIGTRPEGFWSVMNNESELLEKFNIQTVPITLMEIIDKTKKKLASKEYDIKFIDETLNKIDCKTLRPDDLEKMAALSSAMEEWANEEQLDAIAQQCWTAMQASLGIMPCYVNAELTDKGIPIACECDINGAVSAALLQAATLGDSSIFFSDVTIRHPENDNAGLLWHCGNFPYSLKSKTSSAKMIDHYVLPDACPGVEEWELKNGDLTIIRFDAIKGEYRLLIGEGHGISGPRNTGTYVWFEVNDWRKWENKLIRGPYIHHVAVTYGKLALALYEACRYLPGLLPDPVEPSMCELEQLLMQNR